MTASVDAMKLPDFSLAGQTALLTAASLGIGAAIALAFAHAGADLVINYIGDDAPAEAVADRGRAWGRHISLVKMDLSAPGSAHALLAEAAGKLGRSPDILVSCGAIQVEKHWSDLTDADIDAHWALNGRTAFQLVQAALPAMIERRHGRIITVGSVQEIAPEPEMPIYAGLKAAQANWVRNLAKQVAASGVTINNLAPGAVATPRNEAWVNDPEAFEAVRARIPVGFVAGPDDISGAALFLASDAARYMTGTTLLVDGGFAL